MNYLKAMKQALNDICGARLCEMNSMSSRGEMLRLMDKAADQLRAAIEAWGKEAPFAWGWEWDNNGCFEFCEGSKPDEENSFPLYLRKDEE